MSIEKTRSAINTLTGRACTSNLEKDFFFNHAQVSFTQVWEEVASSRAGRLLRGRLLGPLAESFHVSPPSWSETERAERPGAARRWSTLESLRAGYQAGSKPEKNNGARRHADACRVRTPRPIKFYAPTAPEQRVRCRD
jgi:hypothetical protein